MFGINFDNPESILYKGYRMQVAATLALNILTISHGIGLGWVAPTLLKLQSDNSPMKFTVSVDEASWIGAIVAVGGFTGNLLYGFLIDRIGRKRCIYLIALPHMCFWILVFFTSEIYHLYIARLLAGTTGGGVFVVNPIFVAEIADKKIRGTLGSLVIFTSNTGILLGFIVASHVPFFVIPCILIVLPVIYLLCWLRLQETPHFLLRNGHVDAAENSLRFYKNICNNETKETLEKFNSEFINLKLSIQTTKASQGVSLKDFCNKQSIRALLIGSFLIFLNAGVGIFAIINYSSIIFAETGSTLDPNTNTIIIGTMQIIGSSFATTLVDKCGRKILMLISTIGLCVGMTGFGVYSHVGKYIDLRELSWLPTVLMSFAIFISNIGVISLTFVILVEILPTKIRSLGTAFCMTLLCIFMFTILKIFPILIASIGLAGVMAICASVSLSGFVFVLLFIKETNGKSLDN